MYHSGSDQEFPSQEVSSEAGKASESGCDDRGAIPRIEG